MFLFAFDFSTTNPRPHFSLTLSRPVCNMHVWRIWRPLRHSPIALLALSPGTNCQGLLLPIDPRPKCRVKMWADLHFSTHPGLSSVVAGSCENLEIILRLLFISKMTELDWEQERVRDSKCRSLASRLSTLGMRLNLHNFTDS